MFLRTSNIAQENQNTLNSLYKNKKVHSQGESPSGACEGVTSKQERPQEQSKQTEA